MYIYIYIYIYILKWSILETGWEHIISQKEKR